MEKKGWKILLCAAAMKFSCLSAAIGWGFMGDLELTFKVRCICEFFFNMPPIFIVAMIRSFLQRKNTRRTRNNVKKEQAPYQVFVFDMVSV